VTNAAIAQYTTSVVVAAAEGTQWPGQVNTTFAPWLGNHSGHRSHETLLAVSPYRRNIWAPGGDGTYVQKSTVVGGFGVLGIALGAATLGGSALANAARRQRAKRAMAPRWRPIDDGDLYVSSHGFYLSTRQGALLGFGWDCITQITREGSGALCFHAQLASGGSFDFQLCCDYSDLVFLLWAAARNPGHPQIRDAVSDLQLYGGGSPPPASTGSLA